MRKLTFLHIFILSIRNLYGQRPKSMKLVIEDHDVIDQRPHTNLAEVGADVDLLRQPVDRKAVDIEDPAFNDANTWYPNQSTYLQANAGARLNTASSAETPQQKKRRLDEEDPDDFIQQEFNPLEKHAICFNEPYRTNFSAIDQNGLYKDYQHIFDWGIRNTMGPPLQGYSEGGLSINRLPGMFLRMCFHDNAIDPKQPHFQDYIDNFIRIDSHNQTRWTGPMQFLETSGADASNLVCSVERFHPNQNLEGTASRVLFSLQSKDIQGIVDTAGNPTNMVGKYNLSYADLLHNGCLAATKYLRRDKFSSSNSINYEAPSMLFGRKDACRYKWKEGKRKALCGPTELLPGLALTTKESNDWFIDRGMTPCQFMALMWTHSTLAPMADNVGNTCPLTKLPCGEELDYFTAFLQPGQHRVASVDAIEEDKEAPNCNWTMGDTPARSRGLSQQRFDHGQRRLKKSTQMSSTIEVERSLQFPKGAASASKKDGPQHQFKRNSVKVASHAHHQGVNAQMPVVKKMKKGRPKIPATGGYLDELPTISKGANMADKSHFTGEESELKTWPLTAIDCTLSLDVTSRAALDNPMDENLRVLKDVIQNFHMNSPEQVLICALRMLGGRGDSHDCDDIPGSKSCTEIGTDKVSNDHMFGGYYGHP